MGQKAERWKLQNVRELGVLCKNNLKKVVKKFGALVGLLYFCTRFRAKTGALLQSGSE